MADSDRSKPDAPAPAWYPDPQHESELRWWNGARWTSRTSTRAAVDAARAAEQTRATAADQARPAAAEQAPPPPARKPPARLLPDLSEPDPAPSPSEPVPTPIPPAAQPLAPEPPAGQAKREKPRREKVKREKPKREKPKREKPKLAKPNLPKPKLAKPRPAKPALAEPALAQADSATPAPAAKPHRAKPPRAPRPPVPPPEPTITRGPAATPAIVASVAAAATILSLFLHWFTLHVKEQGSLQSVPLASDATQWMPGLSWLILLSALLTLVLTQASGRAGDLARYPAAARLSRVLDGLVHPFAIALPLIALVTIGYRVWSPPNLPHSQAATNLNGSVAYGSVVGLLCAVVMTVAFAAFTLTVGRPGSRGAAPRAGAQTEPQPL